MNKHFLIKTVLTFLFIVTTTTLGLAQSTVTNSPSKKPQTKLSKGLIKKEPLTLLPEGFQISGLTAKLIQHPTDQRWFLKFQSESNTKPKLSANQSTPESLTDFETNSNDPFSRPIEVLPCQWLTKMVSVAGKKTDLSITFRIWAEVTTYQKKNYILPKDVYSLSLFGSSTQKAAAPASPGLPTSALSTQESEPTTDPQDKFKLPAKLRKILMEIPRPQPIVVTELSDSKAETKSTTRRSFTVGGSTRTDLAENVMITDRVGRLAYDPDTQYWLFAFEADGQSLAEPPIALLPSQLLEIVEKILQKTSRPAKFRLSGQVTRYLNKNYLLPRKLLIVQDRENLDK